MIRKIYRNVNLNCVMQQKEMVQRDCRRGLLSRDDNGEFCFQETLNERRRHSRPKLFDGELVSLVRLEDGSYRVYLKAKRSDMELHDSQFPFRVYLELKDVFRFINELSANENENSETSATGSSAENRTSDAQGCVSLLTDLTNKSQTLTNNELLKKEENTAESLMKTEAESLVKTKAEDLVKTKAESLVKTKAEDLVKTKAEGLAENWMKGATESQSENSPKNESEGSQKASAEAENSLENENEGSGKTSAEGLTETKSNPNKQNQKGA